MRRFLSTSFMLLALVVGTAGVVPTVHAAAGDSCTGENYGVSGKCQASCSSSDNTDTAPSCGAGLVCCSTTAVITAANANTAANAAAVKAAEKSVLDTKGTTDDAYNGVMQKILTLFAWLVGIAAITLDNSVYYTVVTMGDYVHNLSAIGVTWRILRDIGNIMLIFGFLAVGITTILNVDWYGSGKKMLPMMLVAAIFLNFSLFISEAIIDTGNLFATQFYTQINGGKLAGAKNFDLTSIQNDGIANKIMGQLGFSTFYGNALTNPELLKGNSPWILGFLGVILFIITAFVFFSLAFVLITRFVVLIFLIILAPVGFAGLAVPQLRARAKKWWDTLFEQTITAPILLLMLYIALAVITDAQFLIGSRSDWTSIVTNKNITGFGSMLLSFLVAMGLLLAVVVQSKNLGAIGAATMMKLGKGAVSSATSFAGRSTLNVGRFAVNRTAGRAAHVASQAVLRSDFGQTQVGRLVATGLGKGGKGFKEAKEKSAKAHEAYAKSVGAAIEEKHTPALVAAQLKRETAEKGSASEIKTAMAEQEEAVKAAKPLTDEVKRLEAIISSKGKFDPERVVAERNLAVAKEKAAPAEAKVKAAEEKVTVASASLTEAMKEETEVTNTLKEAKKKAALAYAESAATSFKENPITWTMVGPGGSAAANKIFKDTLKKMSDNEKLLDELKKSISKEIKASGSSSDTSEKLNKAKENLTDKTEKETEPDKS